MRKTASQIIEELTKQPENRCCPNCTSKGPYLVVLDQKHEDECFDSFTCVKCGQHWSEGYELVYFARVQYKEFVGDMAREPKL